VGRRLQRLAHEGAAFTAVNVVATVLALVLFNLLVHGVVGSFVGPMNQRPLSAYLIANSIAMVVSFLGTREFVYQHRKPMGPAGGFVNYAAVNLTSFVIPVSCLWISRNLMHLADPLSDNISGNLVGAGLGTLFRFWAFRRFVFKVDTPVFRNTSGVSPHHRTRRGRRSAHPEVGPHEAELVEHQPQEWHADPDHIVRIPGHP
jgi:putative flippase GtrA